MNTFILDTAYLAAAVLLILGLRGLSSPQTAQRGILLAEIGMFFAVIGTLFGQGVIHYEWIIVGLVIGSVIGAVLALRTPMTAMPQLIAFSHAFGALAVTLVGIVTYREHAPDIDLGLMAAIGFEVLLGSLTITGSLMALGKLQEVLPGVPITYRFQNATNLMLLAGAVGILAYVCANPGITLLFYALLVLGAALGVLMVMPIGGADMPVVLALLNAYAGLAAAATGFAINNTVLIVAGALDGASGFFLSLMMCQAMNRSFTNILFGAVGVVSEEVKAQTAARQVIHYTVEDAKFVLSNARSVIIIPGYGMAVAQAQHVVQELATLLMQNGTQVRYAVHPVAGRMPGHMNVLLAEANVPYDMLYEPEQINSDFANTDAVLVVGANDIVNPAARYRKESPLYGMLIFDADKAQNVIILKRSLNPGFAGEDNELFYDTRTMLVFGDAKTTLTNLVQAVRKEELAHVG